MQKYAGSKYYKILRKRNKKLFSILSEDNLSYKRIFTILLAKLYKMSNSFDIGGSMSYLIPHVWERFREYNFSK